MDKSNGKMKLNDELLDNVSGGVENVTTSVERYEDGTCPTCGGPAYRVVEKGYLGPFETESTYRECPVHGWISV